MKKAKQWLAAMLAAGMAAGAAAGAEVTQEEARAAAEAWCAANAGVVAGGARAVSARSEKDGDGRVLWHEVAMADGGRAFVAPDDRINPVVAYVPVSGGPLPAGHPLRAMLEADMGRRLAAIGEGESATARRSAGEDDDDEDGVAASVARARSRWGTLADGGRKGVRAATAGTPALVYSHIEGWAEGRLDHWNQNGWNRYGSWSHLYDLYTPNHHPCGCVATAGAALLQHFGVSQAPAKTNRCWVDGVATDLATKGLPYDWSLLPETWADKQSLSEAQIDLLGRATYDMGVCLGMGYAADGSSASISTLASSLRSDFGMADARCFFSGVSATNYPKLVYNQLRAGAPVVLSLSGTPGGHAVLAVGYGEDDAGIAYTRVFMGWGGSFDGWYQLPEVDEFTTLDGVVTMLGADTATLALCGRVTTADGAAAAFEKVTVSGVVSAETETDANGAWGVRVKPVAGVVAVSCAGAEATAEVGSAAAATSGSVGAAALAAALPGALDLVAGQTDVLSAYSSPEAARLAALRQGKLLFLEMGWNGCQWCRKLKEHIQSLGTSFSDDYVFCFVDTTRNDYGFDDGTFDGVPAWAVIDPRRFDPADHWTSEGIFHKQAGYGEYSTDYWLGYGRTQWKTLGAAPAALVVDAPANLAMPKALAASLRFPDGAESDVSGAVAWSLVSGTAATLSGNTLNPVAGASGEVVVRCEGTFWNRAFAAEATVRVVGGIALEALEIEGPDVFDLYDEPSAQFSAVAVFSDGSRAEVDAEWSAETTGTANYMQCSSDGLLSFAYYASTVYQSVTVTVSAASSGLGASRDVIVHGPGYVRPVSFVVSQNALWPGAEVELVPQKVQWWRHGVLEPPTEDLGGVEFSWWMYCSGSGYHNGRGTTLLVPADAISSNGYASVYLYAQPDRDRYYDDYYGYQRMNWHSAPVDFLAVDFDADGGTTTVPRVLRTAGSRVDTLPEASRPGCLFDGWFRTDDGAKVTSSTTVTNAFSCKAKWSRVVSVDILGPSTAAETSKFALAVAVEDGTTRTVTNGVSWSLVSGDAAVLAADGTLAPVPGRTGNVEVCASAVVAGGEYNLCKIVRIIAASDIRSLRVEGPDLIDLYDVPGGQYRAFATTASGEFEVTPAWSAEGIGARYMQISAFGELSFYYDTYTVSQCATAVVTAVYCGLTNSASTLLYGPGYVTPVSFVVSQDALWPGAEVALVPQKVRWWRHGVLEPPTGDFTDVEFSWRIYCQGSGFHYGGGTTITVPSDAFSTNDYANVYLYARPVRDRYYNDSYGCEWLDWHSSPADLLAVDFDADGGTSAVSRVLRTTGACVGTLPETARPGCLFDGWFRKDDGAKVTASTTVTNAFACKAKWSRVVSVDILGPSVATGTSKFALALSLEDGTARTVTNGVSWSLASGSAATLADDGTLEPVPGRTGNVEVCASAVIAGEDYSLCKSVRILSASDIRSLRVEGPDLIDLYDVPGGQYRAFATTASGEYEVTPAWSAEGTGTSYMQISELGELSFYYNTYTVYKCATAVVTAAYCGLTNSTSTLLYGPGYVYPVTVGLPQNALWPGARVELSPGKVRWWRHGVLEEPTGDLADVEFSWRLYCSGSGYHYGDGTTVTVPADAFSTNGYATIHLYAKPSRDRYYNTCSDYGYVHFTGAEPAAWVTVSFDANGGESSSASVRYLPGSPYRFLPSLSLAGYSGSWYTEREGGDSVTTSSTVPSADTTLHAQWSANYYRIVFDANGGEGAMSDQTFYYGTPGNLRSNAFTLEDDTFAGWALSPEGEVVFADGAEILNLRDAYDYVTLYAVWPRSVFADIALDPNGGSVSPAKRRAAVGKRLGTLPLPRWTGHAFAGWYTAAEGGTHVRRGMRVPGPATLYAHWAEGTAPAFADFAITNSATAIATAIREDKLLFVLHGADWCGYCHVVESWLAARWAELQSDFTVYYCDGDHDDTIWGAYPEYGVFDPAAFAGNWTTGCYAHITGGSDERAEKVVAEALANSGRLGSWGSDLARLPDGATAAEVAAAIAAAGFADPGVARAIGGRAAAFNAFVEWASTVRNATGAAAAGTSAVVADSRAAAAYLLGAERLFAGAPSIAFESVAFPGGSGSALAAVLAVRDPAGVVPVSAGKAGGLLESADSPAGLTDGSAVAPAVEAAGTDADGRIHLSLTPANPAAPSRTFLRLRLPR